MIEGMLLWQTALQIQVFLLALKLTPPLPYEKAKTLYAKWKYVDVEEVVKGPDFLLRQKCKIKNIGSVLFGFALQVQIEAIWTLFYERTSLGLRLPVTPATLSLWPPSLA